MTWLSDLTPEDGLSAEIEERYLHDCAVHVHRHLFVNEGVRRPSNFAVRHGPLLLTRGMDPYVRMLLRFQQMMAVRL